MEGILSSPSPRFSFSLFCLLCTREAEAVLKANGLARLSSFTEIAKFVELFYKNTISLAKEKIVKLVHYNLTALEKTV